MTTPELSCKAEGLEPCCRCGTMRGHVSCNVSLGHGWMRDGRAIDIVYFCGNPRRSVSARNLAAYSGFRSSGAGGSGST
jgi:hypothetical protein